MVVIDATVLMLFLRPDSARPVDVNGHPIERAKERIDLLIENLEAAGTKILIPTPALSEVLVRAGAQPSQRIVEEINRLAVFRIEPFDTRAAIEVAAMTRSALDSQSKKQGSAATWAKLKYDRQIVAVAKVNQADSILSDDRDIRNIARRVDIEVTGLADLPLPEATAQLDAFDESPE